MTEVPANTSRFSKFRATYRKSMIAQLFSYMGPAVIVSIAYMDPGNYGTDIQGGAAYNYDLLWVVWLASAMAMLLQYLSGKLGITTGKSLPEILREKLKKKIFIIPYWFAAETAACDYRLGRVSWNCYCIKFVIWRTYDLCFNIWSI